MTNRNTIKKIKDLVYANQIVVKGNRLTFRRSFFYTNGGNSDKFANRIMTDLASLKVAATLVDKGEVWKAFKGGASVVRQSHWFATVELKDV